MKALACTLALLIALPAWAGPPSSAPPPAPVKPPAKVDVKPPVKVVEAPLSPLQSPEASLSPLHLGDADLQRAEHRARWKRNIGIGLAIPGIALVVLGSVLVGSGLKNSHLVTGADEIAGGAIGGAGGLLLTIPGVVLWVKGQDDLDVVAWRRRRMESDPTR